MILRGALILAAVASAMPLSGETLRRVDAPDILEIVREERGNVVLLNFWATWCAPCIVEFPEIVAVEKSFRERGVVVVSVSADFADKIDASLLPFLEKHRPGFPVLLKQTDDIDEFIRTIDREWDGTIPATFFINRDGEVESKRFSAMSRMEMERVLEALLRKRDP